MAEPQESPQKLTMSSTKKEMLAAYNELLKKYREKEQRTLDAQKQIQQKQTEQILKTADSVSTEGVVTGIGSLKAEIGTLLTQLSDRLEEEVNKYKAVRKAAEVKEKELAEIYEIEKAAGSLAALLEAQQQKREAFEAEMASRKEELQGEIEATRFEWQEEKARHAAETKERDTAEQKRRQREKEEYEYTFQREQKLARHEFEDRQGKLEAELAARKEQLERELTQREEAVGAREKELEELRRKVEAFPQELAAAVDKAVKETTEQVRLEAQNKERLLLKEFEGEKNVLTARIESLEKTVKEQSQQIGKLSQALEKAYQQVQDIAVKTVESSSTSKALAGLEQFLSEQRRVPKEP